MKCLPNRFFSVAILFLLLASVVCAAAAPQPDSVRYATNSPLTTQLQLARVRLDREHQALARLRARLHLAEYDRRRAWLSAATLAAGLVLTLGLGWWASRRWRQRAAHEEHLRARLAADLHDEVGTLLARVSMQADLLHQQQPEPSPALTRLLGNSHAAARTMRDIVWSIDAQADTVGALLDRIRDYLDHTATPAGLRTQLRTNGLHDDQPLPSELRQHLYLIFKEAVANTLQHAAHATTLTVTLTHYAVARDLLLTIEDDGDPATPAGRQGVGLHTMQLRATTLRGTLAAGRRSEGGFRVQLQVPFG
jgi:signal transduction histidine kinase